MPNPAVDVNSWAGSACYPRSTFYPLSDGISTHYRRITNPCFRTCSSRRTRSQAPFYVYALHAITIRAEGTFGCLRYLFGGDRPSQTTHLTLSGVLHTRPLDLKHNKGGISTVTPHALAHTLHSLPPILHMLSPKPISSCSKGSRGLSVPLRVAGVFTGSSTSPSASLRQCPSRYTIRAGRNLPDKEFRYLRTVIVTAAVYRGFNSKLLPYGITSPLNLPAPGRCQSLYGVFRLRRDMCFC